jgi:hypothetical protein
LPDTLEEEDANIAERIVEVTHNRPFIAFCPGWKASWREAETFVEAEALSGTRHVIDEEGKVEQFGSLLVLERCSFANHGDTTMKISVPRQERIRKDFRGREIIVIGPREKMTAVIDCIRFLLPSDLKKQEIFQFPIKITGSTKPKRSREAILLSCGISATDIFSRTDEPDTAKYIETLKTFLDDCKDKAKIAQRD